jgi:hypothetical protein
MILWTGEQHERKEGKGDERAERREEGRESAQG